MMVMKMMVVMMPGPGPARAGGRGGERERERARARPNWPPIGPSARPGLDLAAAARATIVRPRRGPRAGLPPPAAPARPGCVGNGGAWARSAAGRRLLQACAALSEVPGRARAPSAARAPRRRRPRPRPRPRRTAATWNPSPGPAHFERRRSNGSGPAGGLPPPGLGAPPLPGRAPPHPPAQPGLAVRSFGGEGLGPPEGAGSSSFPPGHSGRWLWGKAPARRLPAQPPPPPALPRFCIGAAVAARASVPHRGQRRDGDS